MKIIGLTGGIGSGKSTVSRFLGELGATVLNADEVGHQAFIPNSEAWCEVVAAFGRQILARDGSIDRRKLGELVFAHPESLSRLNQVMHPRIYGMVTAQLEEYRQQGVNVVVLEAPLLIETGWTSLVDEVWVTTAPDATVLKRLRKRNGLTEEEVLARIHSQLPSEERLRHADVVIDTDCSRDELKSKVQKLWQGLQLQDVHK